MLIILNNTQYDLPDMVVQELSRLNDVIAIKGRQVAALEDAIATYKLKKETALHKPNKTFRLLAWQAERDMFNSVGRFRVEPLFKH